MKFSVARSEKALPTAGYAANVPTIQDIRRANLRFLLEECAADIGKTRGDQSELARRTGVKAPQISQFLNGKTHQGGGKRTMGDDSARKLERGMDKPIGWMDVDRTIAKDYKEAQLLDNMRELSPEHRAAVWALIESLKPKP